VKPPSSVLLLDDHADPRATREAARLKGWLEERRVRVQHAGQVRPGADLPTGDFDLVLVLGGDGTFLRALHHLGPGGIPFLGIRFGSFGFLAELEPESWEPELERLLAGEGRIEHWMQICCRIREPDGRVVDGGLAVNEVVVTAAKVARMLEVVLVIDGEDITTYRGDGMIVATPVGSTAHSLAAGGPIAEPTDRCLLLTPLSSQAMTFRPLVLTEDRRVELKVGRARSGTMLTIDGAESRPLESGSVVELSRSESELQVATIVRRSRFRTLRERLHWGAPLVSGPETG
jgi:NAD+ kinase